MLRLKGVIKLLIVLIRINWYKTIVLNFTTLPLAVAVKLPMLVFGPVKLICTKGNVHIKGAVSFGMIQIGRDVDHHPISCSPVKINLIGNIIFDGHVLISGGATITVWKGELALGRFVSIGSGVQLKVKKRVEIGSYTRIVALTTIMDSNIHYIKDVKSGDIRRNEKEIIIGNNCWINQGAIVTKGAYISSHSIVARDSFVNKAFLDGFVVIAGAPAKVISKNKQTIWDYGKESALNSYFNENQEEDTFSDSKGVFEEPTYIPHAFRLYE